MSDTVALLTARVTADPLDWQAGLLLVDAWQDAGADEAQAWWAWAKAARVRYSACLLAVAAKLVAHDPHPYSGLNLRRVIRYSASDHSHHSPIDVVPGMDEPEVVAIAPEGTVYRDYVRALGTGRGPNGRRVVVPAGCRRRVRVGAAWVLAAWARLAPDSPAAEVAA